MQTDIRVTPKSGNRISRRLLIAAIVMLFSVAAVALVCLWMGAHFYYDRVGHRPYSQALRRPLGSPGGPAPNRVRVIVEESYGGTNVRLPYAEFVQEVLRPWGIELAPATAADVDATVRIAAKGRPLSAGYSQYYSSSSGKTQYTGAELSGTVSVERRGYDALSISFSCVQDPADWTHGGHSDPMDAPFSSVFLAGGGYCYGSAVLEAMARLYGPSIVIRAVLEKDYEWPKVQSQTPGQTGLDVMPAVQAVLPRLRHDRRALDLLVAGLEDLRRRAHAAFLLGHLKDPSAFDPLLRALRDGDLGHETGFRGFVRSLVVRRDQDLRRGAAFALGRIGDRRAADPLLRVLHEESPNGQVWEAAAEALGELGDTRAIAPLIASLKYGGAGVSPVSRTLKKLTGQDFGLDRAKWEAWWAQQTK